MPKTSKALSALAQIARNPWLLNKILEDDKYWKKKVTGQFAGGFPVIMPWELFGDFNEEIEPFAFLDGGSLPTDLALLKKLARSIDQCIYFEIGTWRGESVANVASVAKQCTTLNLSRQEILSMGMSAKYADLHGFFSRPLPNVTHLEGNTKSYDFAALNSKYDLIFIDGDHHYEMVKNDTAKVFSHLIHDRSVVVWHDYARNPEVVRYEVMAGILDGCPSDMHHRILHVAHTLCAVLLPDGHQGVPIAGPVKPQGAFRVEISFRKSGED